MKPRQCKYTFHPTSASTLLTSLRSYSLATTIQVEFTHASTIYASL